MDTRLLIAAAALAVSTAAGLGGAVAAPWEHPAPRVRHEIMRNRDERMRAYESLRLRQYRDIGTPVAAHGRLIVRARNRFGRLVFVEMDPATFAITGEFRA
jgi:hypothetical protein